MQRAEQRPLRIFCKEDPELNIAVRGDDVILVPADPNDKSQKDSGDEAWTWRRCHVVVSWLPGDDGSGLCSQASSMEETSIVGSVDTGQDLVVARTDCCRRMAQKSQRRRRGRILHLRLLGSSPATDRGRHAVELPTGGHKLRKDELRHGRRKLRGGEFCPGCC